MKYKRTKYKYNFQGATCRDTSLHCNSRSRDQSPHRHCSLFCCPRWVPCSGRRRIPCWPFHDRLHDPQAWHHLVQETHVRIESCCGDVVQCRQQMSPSGDDCVFGLLETCSQQHLQYLSCLSVALIFFSIVMSTWHLLAIFPPMREGCNCTEC